MESQKKNKVEGLNDLELHCTLDLKIRDFNQDELIATLAKYASVKSTKKKYYS
jgi:hypothetical protein